MKNVSFLQLVLGVGGALLIYSGVKDLDIQSFLHTLVTNPAKAFDSGYFHTAKVTPSSNPTTQKPPSGTQQI